MFRLQIRGSKWKHQKPSEGWSANIGYNDENEVIPVVTNEPKKKITREAEGEAVSWASSSWT
jgi:hypothetical protein